MRLCVTLAAAALGFFSLAAQGQENDGGVARPPVALPGTDGGAPAVPALQAHDDALRAQILQEVQQAEDQKLARMRDELRDEMRAEMTSAATAPQEFEQLPADKPKLNFFEVNGYYRLRPVLFQNLWLGWTRPDPMGYYLFTKPLTNGGDGKTVESADMRLRVEPTFNVSENIRIRSQIDLLDNLVLGSTPTASTEENTLAVLSQNQTSPESVGDTIRDSIRVKRVWAEVMLPPIGQFRFGRMGSHWGLGIFQNDGNCLDCDYGNTVDRMMLILKIANHYIIPMIDWVASGPLYNEYANDSLGQPVSYDRLLQAYQYTIEIARKDSDEDLKRLEEEGKSSFNYGFYGLYRAQGQDLIGTPPTDPNALVGSGGGINGTNGVSVLPSTDTIEARNANFYVPDLWARYKTKRLRLEAEAIYVNGGYTVTTDGTAHQINVNEFGAAFEGDLHLLPDGALTLGFDAGLATGNSAYGFGNRPGRGSLSTQTQQGSIDGTPIYCPNGTEPCPKNNVNAFNFNRDYRVDLILWREILGGVTDAFYAKPTARYQIIEGLDATLSVIYSEAMSASSTPGQHAPLGLEFDAGVHYKTDDGFVAGIDYGLLVPFDGLGEQAAGAVFVPPSVAQAIRLMFAVKY